MDLERDLYVHFTSYNTENTPFVSQHLRMPKDNEYAAFSRVTRSIQAAMRSENRIEMIAAVNANNQLWTVLAADLSHTDNKLPDATKAGLLSLAIFSINQGRAILATGGNPEILVEINICVMRGLRGVEP